MPSRRTLAWALAAALAAAGARAQIMVKALRVSRVAAPDHLVYAEFELWTPEGTNAARQPGVSATASSVFYGDVAVWGPQNLVDGVIPVGDPPMWHSGGSEPETWAQVTLPAPTAISVLTVWLRSATAPSRGFGDSVQLLDAAANTVWSSLLSSPSQTPAGLVFWNATLPATTSSPTQLRSFTRSPGPTPSRSPAASPGACPPGWVLPPGSSHCFRGFTDRRVNQEGAHELCLTAGNYSAGAGLATIRSHDEGEFVVRRFCGLPAEYHGGDVSIWTGLNDVAQEAGRNRTGPWTWSSGADTSFIKSSAGQRLWSFGEPNNSGEYPENCVGVLPSGTLLLNDLPCEVVALFACCELPRAPLRSPQATSTPYACRANGFESGQLRPYAASPPALVSVVGSALSLGNASVTLTPLTGFYMARLVAGAQGVYTTMSLRVDVAADGVTLSFDALFDGGDTGGEYNDDARVLSVVVVGPGNATNITLWVANISQVGARANSGWVRRDVRLGTPGSHTLTFAVRNVGDGDSPSALLVDNARVCVAPPTPSATLPPSPRPSPGACPPGWTLPPGSDFCYRGYAAARNTWGDAHAQCRVLAGVQGSGLATIRSPAEAQYVVRQRCGLPAINIWIGLNDIAIEAGGDRMGPWAWVSNSSTAFMMSPAGQELWAGDQPDNSWEGENCVHILDSPSTLNDQACGASSLAACCEAPRAPLATRLPLPCASTIPPGAMAAVGYGLSGVTPRFYMNDTAVAYSPVRFDPGRNGSCATGAGDHNVFVTIDLGARLQAGSFISVSISSGGSPPTIYFLAGCPVSTGANVSRTGCRRSSVYYGGYSISSALGHDVGGNSSLVGATSLVLLVQDFTDAVFSLTWEVVLPCSGNCVAVGTGTAASTASFANAPGAGPLFAFPNADDPLSLPLGGYPFVPGGSAALVLLDLGAPATVGSIINVGVCFDEPDSDYYGWSRYDDTVMWLGTDIPGTPAAPNISAFGAQASNDDYRSTFRGFYCESFVSTTIVRGTALEDRRFLYVLVAGCCFSGRVFDNARVVWEVLRPAAPVAQLVAGGRTRPSDDALFYGSYYNEVIDGSNATNATLGFTTGVATDACDNTYLHDGFFVRRVSPNGLVYTMQGPAYDPLSSVGWIGFWPSFTLGVDPSGNIVTASGSTWEDNAIIARSSPAGGYTTVTTDTRGDALQAQVDALGNIFFVADSYQLNRVSISGTITTVFGDLMSDYPSYGQLATSVYVDMILSFGIDPRNRDVVVLAMSYDYVSGLGYVTQLIKFAVGGRINILSGHGDLTASKFRRSLLGPLDGLHIGSVVLSTKTEPFSSLALDANGATFMARGSRKEVIKVAPNGIVSTLRIADRSCRDGALATCSIGITALSIDRTGALLIADSGWYGDYSNSPAPIARVLRVPGVAAPTRANGPAACTPPSVAFGHTGTAQYFTVPPGVTTLTLHVWGAGGGGATNGPVVRGGGGAFVNGTLPVTPGETLQVTVGKGGSWPGVQGSLLSGAGGGGWPASTTNGFFGGGGGGFSGVRRPTGWLLVVGGGGGAGGYNSPGGAGGIAQASRGGANQTAAWQTAAQVGTPTTSTLGGGGNATGGGRSSCPAGSGGNLVGGNAASCARNQCGAGGGGWHGGGAGNDAAGGGGSSLVASALRSTTQLPGHDWAAGGNRSAHYAAGVGVGAGARSTGGNGRVVITLPYGALAITPSAVPTP